jgi:hypothetical protein
MYISIQDKRAMTHWSSLKIGQYFTFSLKPDSPVFVKTTILAYSLMSSEGIQQMLTPFKSGSKHIYPVKILSMNVETE